MVLSTTTKRDLLPLKNDETADKAVYGRRATRTDESAPSSKYEVIILKNYLSTAELAELRGCSVQYIRKQILDNKIKAVSSEESANNRMEYLIPLSELSEHESWVYQNQQRAAEGASLLPKPKPEKPWKSLEDFSAENREEIAK